MIPSIIHYCWLSDDPLPKQLENYMATWHALLPDYKFVKWDFNQFDKASSKWVSEAFDNKKYAFAADYIRMYALYTMGGIYLDTDVELLKPFDDLLDLQYFLCNESGSYYPEVAAFGAEKGCEWVRLVLNYYQGRSFVCEDGSFDTRTLPSITKEVLEKNGYVFQQVSSTKALRNSFTKNTDYKLLTLPCDYFSPKSYETGELKVTDNTYSIHQFAGLWKPWEQRFEEKFWSALGLKPHRVMKRFDKWLKRVFGINR